MKFDVNTLLHKLSSRKFWALLAGLIGSLLVAFNVDENSIAQVTAIIGSIASVVTYMLSEAIVDQAREKNKTEVVVIEKEADKIV